MLPLGHIGIRAERGDDRASLFTHDEQYTLMTLWSIFRSPLMFGGDLPSSDASAIALITNPEILEANQRGSGGHQAYRHGDTIAWTADAPGENVKYIAVFNLGEAKQDVDLKWQNLGIKTKQAAVRDLWVRSDLGVSEQIRVLLRPHASVFYKVALK